MEYYIFQPIPPPEDQNTNAVNSGAGDDLAVAATIPSSSAKSLGDSQLESLAAVPEEALWLKNFTSLHTRLTYRDSVTDFLRCLKIHSQADLRQVSRAAIITWRDILLSQGKTPRTVKTRLSALSSLFNHLVAHDVLQANPVRDVKAPTLRIRRGETKALSVAQAKKLLEAPPPDTLQGLRDRAILSVGLQVGPRRHEIAQLKVREFHDEQGFPSLKLRRKGGSHGSVAIHQQCAQRIRAYLEHAGHRNDPEGPLFRPVRKNQLADDPRRQLSPKQIDRIFQHWCSLVGIPGGYSSHSMRATFATTALNNGASLEEVQDVLGHAHSSTTRLYDRRGYNPERSASFFATY